MKDYFAFQWHITDECDQRCKHCYIFAEDTNKQPDTMRWEQIEDTFYNCLDFLRFMIACLTFTLPVVIRFCTQTSGAFWLY